MTSNHDKDMSSYSYGAAGYSDGSLYGELGRQTYELNQKNRKEQEQRQRESYFNQYEKSRDGNFTPTPLSRKLNWCIWASIGIALTMYLISENTDAYTFKGEDVVYTAGTVCALKLWKELLLLSALVAVGYVLFTLATG